MTKDSRTTENLPQSPVEFYIQDQLVKRGIDINDIEFSSPWGSERRYLRYGYWREVDVTGMQDILSEFVIEDDDCGQLYMYDIIESPIDEERVAFFTTFETTGSYPM